MKQIKIKIWFDHHHGKLYIQNLIDHQTKQIAKQPHIKKFLLAHGLKIENLKEPIDTNDVTGLFNRKGILDFLRG